MKKKIIHIVKVGGNILSDPVNRQSFLEGFAALNGSKILVHGGGKIASEIAQKLGLEVKMREGRRITDTPMLEVVTMTYGGLVNKQLVANLQAMDIPAFGLTGADGNSILSKKREAAGMDYGWAGDPENVNVPCVEMLLANGYVPVMAPLTHDMKGNMLNTNADTIASQLASALSVKYEVNLLYCFEQKGVLKNAKDTASIIKKLDRQAYLACKEEGIISGGMIPKTDNAFDALENGVSKVCIMNHGSLESFEKGTNDGYTVIE